MEHIVSFAPTLVKDSLTTKNEAVDKDSLRTKDPSSTPSIDKCANFAHCFLNTSQSPPFTN